MNCLERCSIAIAGVGWNGLDMLPAWMLHPLARQWPSGGPSSQGFLRVLWQLGATNASALILHWLLDIEKQPVSVESSPAFSVGLLMEQYSTNLIALLPLQCIKQILVYAYNLLSYTCVPGHAGGKLPNPGPSLGVCGQTHQCLGSKTCWHNTHPHLFGEIISLSSSCLFLCWDALFPHHNHKKNINTPALQ